MSVDPRRAVTYARQSLTRDVDDSLSLDFQKSECAAFIARQGWQPCGVYVDPDQRGWKRHRPAFDQMLAAIRAGKAETVVVYKLSRFARNLMHQESVIGEIADAGGELVSITEPWVSTSPMVRQILGAVNEQHKRDLSDFLSSTFAARAKRGLHHGYAPLGYTLADGALVLDDAAAETVRRIFDLALAGIGTSGIALRLNADGLTTQRGREWSHATVAGVLRNPAYAGHVQHRGEIIARDAHEPIIPPATWEQTQRVLATRQTTRVKPERASWTEGFVEHACGRRMYLTAHRIRPDAPVRWRYRCNGQFDTKRAGDHPCRAGRGSLYADIAERLFVAALSETLTTLISPAQVAAQLETGQQQSARERERAAHRLDRQIADVQRKRAKLLDMALAGTVDDDLYRDRDDGLKADLAALQAERAAVPAPVPLAVLEQRHIALTDLAARVHRIAAHRPDELPQLLHQLGARLIIAPSGATLRLGPEIAPFFAPS